jgi:hypothetical protein
MPAAMWSVASSHTLASRFGSPAGPSSIGQVMSIVCERKTSVETSRSVSSSALRRIGWSITSWCACSGVSASRLRSAPTPVPNDMTIDSRIESIGGFVTWAKSCLK